jgi:UDP-N-acetylmuramate dehydrogenase
MNMQEHVPLAPLTTLRVGGAARFFIEVKNEHELIEACAYARAKKCEILPLGYGSNILVPDTGVDAVVVKIALTGLVLEEREGAVYITAGAGVSWDAVVRAAAEQSVFGIENLAGIPGSVGAAAVQNIGAYGTELSSVFFSADVLDKHTGEVEQVEYAQGAFSYRTSFFKTHPDKIILRVTLRLPQSGVAHLAYPDFSSLKENGAPLASPEEIGNAVRAIRAQKFPSITEEGTAGSFFKNPLVTEEEARALHEKFPGLPQYPYEGKVKIPLAWILDRVLGLKGHQEGRVRLYERQPLVLVAAAGASADEINTLAKKVETLVHEATGIFIEREVETFGTRG